MDGGARQGDAGRTKLIKQKSLVAQSAFLAAVHDVTVYVVCHRFIMFIPHQVFEACKEGRMPKDLTRDVWVFILDFR